MKKLFEEFPEISTEEWEKIIQRDLKGQDYDKKLVWKTDEGFSVRPYYREDSVSEKDIPNPPGMPASWFVTEEISAFSVEDCLQKFQKSLESGATGWKLVSMWNEDQVYGIQLASREEITQFSQSIFTIIKNYWETPTKYEKPRELRFYWDTSTSSLPYQEAWKEAVQGFSVQGLAIRSFFFQDPLSALTVCGEFAQSTEKTMENLKTSLEQLGSHLPNSRGISVNLMNFAHSGANLTQELGYGIAMGSEYLNLLQEAGISPEVSSRHLVFRIAVGSNYFLEIAKLRALRFLWNQVLSAYEVPEDKRSCEILTETSEWNLSIFDPYVNMLRVTTESMSAVLGGTNALIVHPFDRPFQESDVFSERVARNVQHLLRHESYLDKVVDPSNGSYYINNLTYEFTQRAWELFQKVESSGGYIQAFRNSEIQKEIQKVSESKRSAILKKKEPILGTSQYPNPGEKIPTIQKRVPVATGKAPFPEFQGKPDFQAEPLVTWRAAEDFEALRLKLEENAKNGKKKPQVLLFLTGHRAMRTARAGFATNFFGVAGMEILNPGPLEEPTRGMEIIQNENPDFLVFCSSDEEYKGICEQYLPDLKKKWGKTKFFIAGNPEGQEELKQMGVDGFVHARSPLYETLESLV